MESKPSVTNDQEIPVTALLVEQAFALRREQLPADAILLAKQCILDTLGVAISGHTDPLLQLLLADAMEQGGNPTATTIGGGVRLTVQQAALINGTAAHVLDFDDVNLYISGHPSAVILPALLALGEQYDSSGSELLMAFIAGYELTCRAGVLIAQGHYERGFHATSTVGAFGAAMACAHLLGLSQGETLHALGIVGTQAAGLKSMFGTPCKPLHAGLAARNGIQAAVLAKRGLTSRQDVLECRQGFAATHSPDFHPQRAVEDKARFFLRDNLFKYHAACYGTHSAIECALRLRAEHGLANEDIKSVVVRVEKGADLTCNIASPRTSAEAKFSLRFATSLALAGYDTADLDNYGPRTLADPALTALRERVSVHLVEGWSLMQTEVDIECVDGRKFSIGFDAGEPCSDIPAQYDRLIAKFTTVTAPFLGPERSRKLALSVADIENISVRSLLDLCTTKERV